MYKFDIEINGKVVHTKYNIRDAYKCAEFYAHFNEPIDLHICEYRCSRLYYSWSLSAFLRYCKKIFP